MEILGKDVLSIILTHVPYELVEVISSDNPSLLRNINLIREDNSFWKKRAEILFGKQLQSRKTNWRIVYKNLTKAITLSDYFLYKHDPLLYCIINSSTINELYIIDIVSILLEVGYNPSANDNQAIQTACHKGNIEIVRLLLQDPRVDPSSEDNEAIRRASFMGYTKIVKLLLQHPRVDPSANSNEVIRVASYRGYAKIVKLVLQDPRVDPSDHDNEAIRAASARGYTKIVKLLMQDLRVDPSEDNNAAIQIACTNGYIDIVKLLIHDLRVDPSDNNNECIIRASDNEKSEIVDLLLQADVLDEKAIKSNNLSVYIREYIKDSLSGLLAMHFLYGNVNTKHIYKHPSENKENFIGLYYQILRYLVRVVPSINSSVSYLTSVISKKDLNSKRIILESVKNILYYEKNGLISTPQKDFVEIFTGYFMLSFDPPYTYGEILTKLKYRNKHIMYLTAKLIGAKIGLKRLIENGLQLSPKVTGIIENALKINLIDILD